MPLKVRRLGLLLGALAALALPVVLVGAALHLFSLAASWEIRQRGLPPETHNAIKHTYAAMEVYSALRLLAGPDMARDVATRLGEANELAERYLKPSRDWSPESYKDLRNNISGMAAAEWLYRQAGYTSPFTRLRLAGKLAADGSIVLDPDDPRIPDLPHAPDDGAALAKMKADEAALWTSISGEISGEGAALAADLRLDDTATKAGLGL